MSREDQVQAIVEILAKLQRPSLNAAWKELGLSHAQVGMLFLLAHHKQSSVKQAADFLGISKSAVTQLADPLDDKGLINRSNDTSDRRIVRLSLTDDGLQLLKKLGKQKFAGVRTAVSTLSDSDVTQLYSLLQKADGTLKDKEGA